MIEIKRVKKSYGGVVALDGVNLKVEAGEIHALLGENGAGKSTLMKIISGAILKDEGTIFLDGEEVSFKTTQSAKNKGVGIIYQEFSLVPELSVAENIFLHNLKEKPLINWKKLYNSSEQLIQSLGFNLDVTKKVKHLSVAQQQVVEIAKALTEEVKVLILDEPSAVLGPTDIHKLFSTLRALREKGVAIIYISHLLDELFELTDKITILKDGRSVATLVTKEAKKDELIKMMLGRNLKTMFPSRKIISPEVKKKIFEVSGIKILNDNRPLNFKIGSGEIVGIGGLVGSGRTELFRATFGADKQSAKLIYCNGKELLASNPKEAVKSGIGMVPEDRKEHGGLLNCSIRENISITNYRSITTALGFIDIHRETQIVNRLRKRLNIKMNSPNQPLNSLSGGNQQKVILAKWLNIDAELLLIDEPTRGVDVGAKAEIYQIIHELATMGLAIMIVSSDWEELLGLPDRVIVMHKGKIQGQLDRSFMNEERLLRLAIGE